MNQDSITLMFVLCHDRYITVHVLQNQVFANITYALIGDDTMPSYFNLNTVTGVISVRSSLTAEIRDSYQGRIVAYDGGSPPRSATAIATINILRNLNTPIFNPDVYEQTILETLQVGSSILQVTATDADRSVSIISRPAWQSNHIDTVQYLHNRIVVYLFSLVLYM